MIEQALIQGAAQMGLEISPDQAARFAAYHRLLMEANRVMNLTRVPEDPREAVDRNYLDSLAPLAAGLLPEAESLADVGTGAGLPGIPLSIMLPEVQVVLIDSLGKRVKFLERVIAELGLNALAVHARAEDAGRMPELRERFGLATARAVAPLNALAELCLPLVRVGGTFAAYKGPAAPQEAAEAAHAVALLGGGPIRQAPAPIPGRDWDHRLLLVEKLRPTPSKYPRRPGDPTRSPLT